MKKFLKIVLIALGALVLLAVLLVIFRLFQIKRNQVETQTFTASDGAQIQYADVGSGQPMIFLHGFGGSIAGETGLINAFKDEYRCIAFDQRGFGNTPGTDNACVEQSARDTKDLIDTLGLEDVVLFGYSMGSHVLFSYLDQFGTDGLSAVIIGDMTPKLVNDETWKLGLYQGWYTQELYEKDLKLITEDYSTFYLQLAEQMMFPRTPEEPRDFTRTREELLSDIAEKAGVKPEDVEGLLAFMTGTDHTTEQLELYRRYWKSMGDADYRPLLPNIDVPTAILQADPGSIYCMATGEYMAEQIPDAVLIPMTDSIHTSQAETFSGDIKAFLAGI